MPASIERSIREENLRFMQNRDVFSDDYYKFMYELTTANTVSKTLSENTENNRFFYSISIEVRNTKNCAKNL